MAMTQREFYEAIVNGGMITEDLKDFALRRFLWLP